MTAELKRHQLRYPRAAAEAAAQASAAATSAGGKCPEGEERGGVIAGGKRGAVEDDDPLPPWVTSSEVMSPLLAAYDARIQARSTRC